MTNGGRQATETPSIRYGADLTAGDVYQLGRYEVTEDELVAFATQWDPQAFHIDREVAEAGAYGGLIASGLHTMSIYQKLAAEAMFVHWAVIAGKRLVDVRFLRPVRAGNVLTGTVVLDSVEFDDRGRALVTGAAEVVALEADGASKPVMSVVIEVVVRGSAPQ